MSQCLNIIIIITGKPLSYPWARYGPAMYTHELPMGHQWASCSMNTTMTPMKDRWAALGPLPNPHGRNMDLYPMIYQRETQAYGRPIG